MVDSMYAKLHALVFAPGYPGYRPEIRELPNGDGKVDADKRFAHIAEKYLRPEDEYLRASLKVAHGFALRAARAMGVPKALMPSPRYSAMRVLEYPPGAGSHQHTDFDLFTLMFCRDQPEHFHSLSEAPAALTAVNRQAHLGEIGELIGLGPATPHYVSPSETEQHSIVYFAIPDHAAVLPSGETVGEWLIERMERSRVKACQSCKTS